MRLFVTLLTTIIATSTIHSTVASEVTISANYACPKPNIFATLLDDIPFSSMLPIYVGGTTLGGGKGRIPPAASHDSVCSCSDEFGVRDYGLVVGLWEIAYLIELTREPNCSLVLGIEFPFKNVNLGSAGKGTLDSADLAFYHVHVYSFPLLTMLNMYTDLNCGKSDYLDLDLLYASELDPLWNNELKALAYTPELTTLANPIAVSACSADAVASLTGQTIDELYYCAGSWGFTYPLAGYVPALGSVAENTSLLAVRALQLMHRKGLAQNSLGDKALCGNHFDISFNKNMYRFSMLYPIAESNDNHALGEPVEKWQGDGRVLPGMHDVIYVVWRYRNCCLGAFFE